MLFGWLLSSDKGSDDLGHPHGGLPDVMDEGSHPLSFCVVHGGQKCLLSKDWSEVPSSELC